MAAVDPFEEVLNRLERPTGTSRFDDSARDALSHVLHAGETEANRLLAVFGASQREICGAAVHVGWLDRDACAHALGICLRDALLSARHHHDGRHVFSRVIRLQIGRLVGNGSVRNCVGFVEGIARERLDEIIYLLSFLICISLVGRALKKTLLLSTHHGADLLAHCLAHNVGLAQRVAGELLGDEEHLVLIDDHAVSLVKDFREVRMRIVDFLKPVLGMNVGWDVLHRAGPVERHHGREVLDRGWSQLLHIPGHPAGFELEHSERLSPGEHVIRPGVSIRQVRDIKLRTMDLLDHMDGGAEYRQVGKAQEVHL